MRLYDEIKTTNFCILLKRFFGIILIIPCGFFSQPLPADEARLSFEQARMRVTHARERLSVLNKEYELISQEEITVIQKLEQAKIRYAAAQSLYEKIKTIRQQKKTEIEKATEVLKNNRRQFKKIRVENRNGQSE